MALLQFIPAGPASTTLTVVNGSTSTGYYLLEQGTDWGNAAWEAAYSGPRGTLGAKVATQTPQNRQITMAFRVSAATKDAVAAKLSALAESVDELRRYGGKIKWKSNNATYAVYFDVMAAGLGSSNIATNSFETNNRAAVIVWATCAPYAEGDHMDIADSFTVDTVNGGSSSDYTADAGALTNVAVSGGVLDAAANLTTQNRLIHTATGYTYGDHQATVKAVPGSTISSLVVGVILKRIDASNYLAVYVDDNGANSRLRIDKVVAGSTTNLASTNLGSRMTAGTPLWVRGRIEGNVVYAAHYTFPPDPFTAPTTNTSFVLTGTEAPFFGQSRTGRAGMVFTPQHTDAYLDDFAVWAFAWGGGDNHVNWPAVDTLSGVVPGDAPALADIHIGVTGGGPTEYRWLASAWQKQLYPYNLCWNGDFERHTTTNGWSVAAVTGVTGAATSVALNTTAARCRYGATNLQIVTPATANTGASFVIYRKFLAGRNFVAMLWASAASATTNTRVRLGMNGDIASESAAALSSTPTLRTTTWTPTANRDTAYLAFQVTAATGTTMNIDGVCVFESTPAHLSAAISSTSATSLTVYENPAVLPPVPFLALIDTEIVTVASVSGTTWTVSRGAERTTVATHSLSAPVHILPPFSHLAGAGAVPPLGPISACNKSGTTGVTASANYFLGYGYESATPAAMSADVWVDPSLMEVAGGGEDIMVDLWARLRMSTTATKPYEVNGYVQTSWDKASYTVEFGKDGRTTPTPGADVYRMVRVGSLLLKPGVRQQVTVTWDGNGGTGTHAIDYLFFMPSGSRFAWLSGVDDSDSSYDPIILTSGGYSSAAWKIIRSDLSGATVDLVASGQRESPRIVRTSGVGGSTIEVAPGPVMFTAIVSLAAADPSNSGSTQTNAVSESATFHLDVTPRWAIIRDA